VLATVDGVEWRDWQLKSLQSLETDGNPLALAVDEREQAYLLLSRSGIGHLQVLSPAGKTLVELDLPPEDGPFAAPLLVAKSGQIYVTSESKVLAISAAAKILWRADITHPRALSLSANGLLLVGGDTLDALTAEGKRITLFRPPAPIVTPPVLANDHIYVATGERLYALTP
jgi:sugar lactone lactonase YvrE